AVGDLERELGQGPAPPAARLAGHPRAGRRLPAGDEAVRRGVGEHVRHRAGRPRLRVRARRRGPLERGGHPVQGRPGGRGGRLPRPAGLPGPGRPAGGPRGRRDLRRHPGLVAVRPQRAQPGRPALRVQAGVAGPAGRGAAGGRREPHRADRGHEHRPDRRRRVGHPEVRRLHPRHAAGAGRAGRPAGGRTARRGPGPVAGRAGLHLLGLPGRRLPPGPRHAHRPGPGRRRGGRPGGGDLGRPAGPQGLRPERPRPGHRRPGRGAGRRHRTDGPAAVRAQAV
ncbi:MAG: Exodeoxyribonuclease III, partial [uncultured Corynebacteriales bacterium]